MKRIKLLSALCLPAVLAIAAPGCSDDDQVCSAPLASCGETCVDLRYDPAHCGGCDVSCDAGLVCDAGTCSDTCGGDLTRCDDRCVDTQLDPNNCGSCGNACDAGLLCSLGTCNLLCLGGTTECDGLCVDTTTDEANCGGCGNACGAGETCVSSSCVTGCAVGLELCGDVCVDVTTDPMNCGGCGTVCGGSQVCVLGSCEDIDALGVLLTSSYGETVSQDLFVVADYTLDLIQVNPTTFEADTVIDYAVVPDGSIVLVAAQDTEGVFELYHAPSPGAALVKLSGALVADGDVQPGIVVSDDGSTVLYRADQDADEVIDLYAVTLANPGSPQKLNPALDTDEDVAPGMVLSADGTRVAYIADHDTEGMNDVFVVDLANPGTATRINPAVAGGVDRVAITSDGAEVVYLGDETAGWAELFQVSVSNPGVSTKLSPVDVTGVGYVYDFAITHDDTRVVLEGSPAGEQQRLWVAELSGTPDPTPISQADGAEGYAQGPFVITSDDSTVYYRADTGGAVHLMAADLGSPVSTTVMSQPLDDEYVYVEDFVLSADESTLVYRRYGDGGEGYALYQVDVAAPQVATRLTPGVEENETSVLSDYAVTADGSRVLYRSDDDTPGQVEAYLVSVEAPGTHVKVSPSLGNQQYLGELVVSGADEHGYLTTDADVPFRMELYRVDAANPGSLEKVNAPLVPSSDISAFEVSADGSAIVYRAAGDTVGLEELYLVDAANPGTAGKVSPPDAAGRVSSFEVSADGSVIVYQAEMSAGVSELYAVSAMNLGVAVKLNPQLVAGGNVQSGFQVSTNGAHVVYRADQDTDGVVELYRVAVASPGIATKVSDTLSASADVGAFALSHDETAVAYTANQDADADLELYVVDLAAPGVSTKVNPPLQTNRDVSSDFRWSHDDSFLLYRADDAVDNVIELFRVDLTNLGVAIPVSAAMTTGDVQLFVVSPDDTMAAYRSTHEGPPALYIADLVGASPVTRVHPLMGTGFGVFEAAFTPDSSQIVYFGDLIQNNRNDLYVTPTSSLGTATLLSTLIPTSFFGGVDAWGLTATGKAVYSHLLSTVSEVYLSDPANPGTETRLSPFFTPSDISSIALVK